MDTKIIENWQDYSKGAMASAKELETINTRIVEQITAKQMELANVAFETGTRYMNSLTEVKGVQELLAEQTKLATEFNEKLLETARGTADILTESREAYQAWFEKSFKSVADGVDFTLPGLTPAKKPAAKKAAA
ncbi:MAG: phasin family protein [Gammaproteobacteria bacterium]|nr:phasin family protein [Gammaproteobacteria bacterium]MCP5201826.1 phasin family protein [Gammaproteobacteria bacterium]